MKGAFFAIILFFSWALLPSALMPSANAQGQAEIMPNHTGYLDNTTVPATYHVVGEINNIGTASLELLNVTASFYTQDNSLIGSSSSYTLLDVLLPNLRAPFEVAWVGASVSQIRNYSLSLGFSEYTGERPITLQILQTTVYTDEVGFLKVNGTIRNLATSNATAVRVLAPFYDSQGKVLGIASGYTVPPTIMPGHTENFEIELPRKVGSFADYRVTAESAEYEAIGTQVTINYGATYTITNSVTLILSSNYPRSGMLQMRFSNDNATFTNWEPYNAFRSWTLPEGDGVKTIYAQFMDGTSSVSPSYFDTIILDMTPPEMTIIYPSNGSSIESSLTIRWVGFDATSGIGGYSIKLDNGSQVDVGLNTTQVYTYLIDGEHSVSITANDVAGLSKQTSVIFSVSSNSLVHIDTQTVAVIVATLTILAVLAAAFWVRHSKSEKSRRLRLRAKKK